MRHEQAVRNEHVGRAVLRRERAAYATGACPRMSSVAEGSFR